MTRVYNTPKDCANLTLFLKEEPFFSFFQKRYKYFVISLFCRNFVRRNISKMKKVLILLFFCSVMSAVSAQVLNYSLRGEQLSKPFRHVDLGITLGTSGLGIDLSSPINEYLGVRTGLSFMPSWHYPMNFGIQVGDDAATSHSKFEKLSGLLEQMSGCKVDDSVDMIGRPSYSNFKLLLDVFPFRDKRWHVTAGFYWGKSEIADAYNTTEDMASLMAVNIYNNIYDKVENFEPIISWNDWSLRFPPDVQDRIYDYGRMGIHLGDYSHDVYDDNGQLIHKAGDPYMVEPDGDSMVKARVNVNSFKPYLGFGYGGALLKNDDKYSVSFDCGLLFWGGTPSIVTHDGTDLVNDVDDVPGKVGRYVDIIKGFKVFPVLELKIARKLF